MTIHKSERLAQLITKLGQLDIKLSLDGEELCIDAPKGVLTKALIHQLKEYKPEIVSYLKNRGLSQAMTIAQLKAEATLDEEITPQGIYPQIESISSANCILLTGATGFLGSFILVELLQQTTADIYCLIRAENINLARQKLKKSLKSYFLGDKVDLKRIILIIGDLAKPCLNLSPQEYQELAVKVDVIYHNGALVHHAFPYKLLKNTNVLGTQEILRLACKQKIKPVHFISTISVFNIDKTAQVRVIREQDSIEQFQAPLGGYSQSKWAAEKLISIAGDRGLPVTVYRLGPISGSSETGAFNTNDFLYRLIIGYVNLGSAPAGKMLLDILPVDYVSKAIIYLSRNQASWGKAFHLIHHQPVSSNLLFKRLNAAGYKIERINYEEWYTKLIDIAKNYQEHILYPLVSFFSAQNYGEAQNKSFNLKFDCQNTLEGLDKSLIACPAIDKKLLDTYISFLTDKGLLKTLVKANNR